MYFTQSTIEAGTPNRDNLLLDSKEDDVFDLSNRVSI